MNSLTLGYKASNEQFAPQELLALTQHAEARGFEVAGVSDHLQPWRHNGGHAPAVLPWLGAAAATTSRITLGTSVLTPTMRYHPAIVAQAFATLGVLAPNRIFLGVGTGEAMNETPITGGEFPGRKERRTKMAEAIKVIKLLWEQERVDFEGEYYNLRRATIYDRPDTPVPIFVAASGPLAAKLAGRVGDGFICTSGKDPELYVNLLDNVKEGAEKAGRDYESIKRMIEIKVSYDRDIDTAMKATHWWAALALTPEEKEGVEDPVEMERLADNALDRAHTRFIVSDDPNEIVSKIQPYIDLGFTELVFHFPGNDQRRYIDEFAADVAPLLRK
ncbi:glucose-6-phosphate dehydrogenase (coenzyme-F420) [Solirubrobacter sp. CPCC 204708]|uniref:Glucose-6-phosphate dehydrogenase (Coenzyme-F420) n=1 Tax=Solirubrobacter deserti TaxID=2282478 RepID=A0ABT4RU32_9ACTN|nr:glucose-6-phosphate dehydrogenase (coenzyme-F420) [Solirubrobacter deserti]MBE2314482.1 glucose-6-phosphate dehydrogenase (coenzyme-F420) [Solirubrobacter deserti]MDA0142089.1 glucose-6-phosphate dehydrogenase (coenzyme-F420) [Solirubrobacter deserti]